MSWQDNRRDAHRAGRHTRPQVDCRLCWETGRLANPSGTAERDTEGLFHRGQHPGCDTCDAFRVGPPQEVMTEEG